MPLEQRRGTLWALCAALFIAAWAIPWKLANTLGAPSTNALMLLAAAAVFNAAFTLLRPGKAQPLRPFDVAFAAVLAGLTLGGNLASAEAIRSLSPALLTVAQRSEIILVALMAWPLIGERIDWRFLLGAAVAGAGLVILQDPFDATSARSIGLAWAGLAALAFSSMAVLTRLFIQRIDVASVNGLRLWLSVLLWFLWYGFPPALLEITPAQAGYATLAAFFGPFAGRLCMMTSAKYLEARITALATLAAPPLTLVFGLLLLSDWPSSRELLGGLVMLVGISVPLLTRSRSRPADSAGVAE